MYLSKLTINVTCREFRRDHADIREMHRTVMSGYPDMPEDMRARQSNAVLWRLDPAHRGFVQYIQSGTEPDWSRLPAGYLTAPAQVRSLQPVLDAIASGRWFAFRLVANPTHSIRPPVEGNNGEPSGIAGKRARGKKVAPRSPEVQVRWLLRSGERHGFAIPTGANGAPDVAPSPCPTLIGRKREGERGPITVAPVRFEGHLVVTDAAAFSEAFRTGIGRARAYGCGLLSLAPVRRH